MPQDVPLERVSRCTAIGVQRLEIVDPRDEFGVTSLEPLSSLTVSAAVIGCMWCKLFPCVLDNEDTGI